MMFEVIVTRLVFCVQECSSFLEASVEFLLKNGLSDIPLEDEVHEAVPI
jgi:hypothetical protein